MKHISKILIVLITSVTLIVGGYYAPWVAVVLGFIPNVTQAAQAKLPVNGFNANHLVDDARRQIGVTIRYDPEYTVIPFPNGDVALFKGVCTDVVIRAMRGQGIDLQKLVNADMRKNFVQYPTRWGLKQADANIDHRHVLNLEVFMTRRGNHLPLSQNPTDFKAGDWVTWRVGEQNLPHIGLVSSRKSALGTPLIIHNIGAGTQEEDVLFAFKMVGHYRWR